MLRRCMNIAAIPSMLKGYTRHAPYMQIRHMSYRKMTAADLLKAAVHSRSKKTSFIGEDATLEAAVDKLAKNSNSNTLVVVDQQEKVVGLLTQSNIISHIARNGNKEWKQIMVSKQKFLKHNYIIVYLTYFFKLGKRRSDAVERNNPCYS